MIYDFHCIFIKKNFDAELFFTDTGNLTYQIKSEDAYEEFLSRSICLNSVTIHKIQKFFALTNKKVIEKMKDASEGKINNEFVGLKSKMYSMKNVDGTESNIAKGVNIATEFNEFRDTSFIKKVIRHKMKRIQSKKT